ncbi:hypothetical protein [Longimicrobium sp.]|jgi:hypothetical protein|uniref:hypothetical protein n=1 Tax=Longimicrobium sp. TaxID=2029185 RepID=UPI002F92C702
MKHIRIAGAVAAVAVLGAASMAVAGNRTEGTREGVAPIGEHVQASNAGYQVQVHPAFSSGISIRNAAGEIQLFRQQGTFNLPAGQTTPPSQHIVRLQGGEFDRDVGVVVNDPKHQIARIIVELYGPDHQPGRKSAVVETLVVENSQKTCPPYCT